MRKKILLITLLIIITIILTSLYFIKTNSNKILKNINWSQVYGSDFENNEIDYFQSQNYLTNDIYVKEDDDSQNIKYKYIYPDNINLKNNEYNTEYFSGNNLSISYTNNTNFNMNSYVKDLVNKIKNDNKKISIKKGKINKEKNVSFVLLIKTEEPEFYQEELILFCKHSSKYLEIHYSFLNKKVSDDMINELIDGVYLEEEKLELCKLKDNYYECEINFSNVPTINKKYIFKIDSNIYQYNDYYSPNKYLAYFKEKNNNDLDIYLQLAFSVYQEPEYNILEFYEKNKAKGAMLENINVGEIKGTMINYYNNDYNEYFKHYIFKIENNLSLIISTFSKDEFNDIDKFLNYEVINE